MIAAVLRAIGTAVLFLLALIAGSILAAWAMAAITHITGIEPMTVDDVMLLAVICLWMALLPAFLAGIPALIALSRRDAGRLRGTAAMTLGGAAGGALLDGAMTGGNFLGLTALTWGSVGFLLGLFLLPRRKREASHG